MNELWSVLFNIYIEKIQAGPLVRSTANPGTPICQLYYPGVLANFSTPQFPHTYTHAHSSELGTCCIFHFLIKKNGIFGIFYQTNLTGG